MSQDLRRLSNGLSLPEHQMAGFSQSWTNYEPKQTQLFGELIDSLPADACYVDLGASVGIYPLLAKRRAPQLKVHAYEPLELHRRYFAENITINGFASSDFSIFEEGVSGAPGQVDYFANGFGSTLLTKQSAPLKQRLKQLRLKLRRWLSNTGIKKYDLEFTQIAVVSLQTVIERAGGKIHLLQMDVQGSEGDILLGSERALQAGVIQQAIISTHGLPLHTLCERILRRNGFQIWHNDPQPKHDGLLIARHKSLLAASGESDAAGLRRISA